MRLKAEQLAQHLAKGPAPVYVISGDEPLLVGEAADAVRGAARAAGYASREVLEATGAFDWSALEQAAHSLSLFAERRILELRLPEAKPGPAGARVLQDYAEQPAPDTLLLVLAGKFDKAALNSKWLKALDASGVVVQLWPVAPPQLPAWIERRMRSRGLRPDQEAVAMMAERVEGNLLAAAQEIERLCLLHGAGPVDARAVAGAVADSARFDVYKLADSALAGDAARCVRILAGLQAEGIEPVLVLWALAREVRALATMAYAIEHGTSVQAALSAGRVWDSRKRLVTAGLRRNRASHWRRLLRACARADRVAKGMAAGRPWDELRSVALAVAGVAAAGVPDGMTVEGW